MYERNNTLFNEVFGAVATELNKVGANVDQSEAELFVDTAIQALELYERDLAIPKNPSLSVNQRREQIILYFLKNFERITEETLAIMSDFYTDGQTVVERSERRDGVYKFIFKDGTIPYTNEEFQKMMYKVMPAFLAWEMGSRADTNTYTAIASKSGMRVKIYEEE